MHFVLLLIAAYTSATSPLHSCTSLSENRPQTVCFIKFWLFWTPSPCQNMTYRLSEQETHLSIAHILKSPCLIFFQTAKKEKNQRYLPFIFLWFPILFSSSKSPKNVLIKSISAFSGSKILAHFFKCAFLSAFFSYRDRGEEAAAKEVAYDEEKLFRRSLWLSIELWNVLGQTGFQWDGATNNPLILEP